MVLLAKAVTTGALDNQSVGEFPGKETKLQVKIARQKINLHT